MAELHDMLIKLNFGEKFRRYLHIITAVFLLFYITVLSLPFVRMLESSTVEKLQKTSEALSDVFLLTILLLIVVEGQRSIRNVWLNKIQGEYLDVAEQIKRWLKHTGSEVFHEDAVKFDRDWHEALRNFQVRGHVPSLMSAHNLTKDNEDIVRQYSLSVHFELTMYPAEIIYGIHFELDEYELNRKLLDNLMEVFDFSRQGSTYAINTEIPKLPEWIFFTRTVDFQGGADENHPMILTHLRHFVELVCHTYDTLYGSEMVGFYLNSRKNILQ